MTVQGEVTGGFRPASPSPASLCAMILGLTLFWPIASYPITPDLFLPGMEPFLDDQMTLGGLVQPLLVVAFGSLVGWLDASGRAHPGR